jgi:hypothetical protein
MNTYVKYPSTPHLPFSPGVQRDDTRIRSLNSFENREIIITEKMDGENTTMYTDHIHARSVDSRHHPSRDWVKNFWNSLRMDIPNGFRICGENVYARHSVSYNNLETYFYGFSVWDGDRCLSWDNTLEFFELLNITPVPVIYRGVFNVKLIEQFANNFDVENKEGFVVRVADGFNYNEFDTHVTKWVRAGHVQTDKHWMYQTVQPNKLKV